MNHPILSGESGFILLAVVVGLSAYIRQVYVDAEATYDKVASGELKKLWPVKAQYTKDRLDNLSKVQNNLILVTRLMVFYIFVLTLRLVACAVATIPADIACFLNYMRIPDGFLYYLDLFLLLFLLISFSTMWGMHHLRSKKEREYRKAMWAAFEATKGRPQST